MIVKVSNLVKRYGDLIALDHFKLDVAEGEIFGLLGPNGSGKTTAINCILSLLTFDKGEIEVFDKKMTPSSYDLKKDIGVIMQNVAVIEELTVYENIDFFCGLYVPDKEIRKNLVKEAIDFVGLGDFTKFYPKKLSGGLLRRLNIACGIAHKPRLIILDEPTVAVDPQSRNNILEGIVRLNREGATVIYTSHYMEEVEQICTRIGIMDKGRIVAMGTNEELKGMIRVGEKISIEFLAADPKDYVEFVESMPYIAAVEVQDRTMLIKTERGHNGLTTILTELQTKSIKVGRVYCELPTLNDVFLEITGKELRDGKEK